MDKFIPHEIDYDGSFNGDLLGDVKAGFPSPAEDIREKLDLIKLLVKLVLIILCLKRISESIKGSMGKSFFTIDELCQSYK